MKTYIHTETGETFTAQLDIGNGFLSGTLTASGKVNYVSMRQSDLRREFQLTAVTKEPKVAARESPEAKRRKEHNERVKRRVR